MIYTDYKPKYLVMVETSSRGDGVDHNKFYSMNPINDSVFEVEYGRVGATHMKKRYARDKWDKIYSEKIAKGYVDQTEFHIVSSVDTTNVKGKTYKDIAIDSIRDLVGKMLSWANMVISKNYTVSTDQVSQEAVDKAQDILDNLADKMGTMSVWEFNERLKSLFLVIPRKMAAVDKFLAKDQRDFEEIIDREQSLLDTIGVSAGKTVVSKKATDGEQTVLEANGLEIRECTPEELKGVKDHLDPETKQRFMNAWHVTNKESRERFDAYCKKHKIGKRGIKYYYHGSRNANYWNIAVQGLKIRPTQKVTRAGAMFGHGLYFAPKAKKSMGYTDGGFWSNRTNSSTSQKTVLLMVFKVAMGKSKDLDCFSPTVANWHEADCRKAGYDSVFAHASNNPGIGTGRLFNDECIVYNDDAATISYILQLSA